MTTLVNASNRHCEHPGFSPPSLSRNTMHACLAGCDTFAVVCKQQPSLNGVNLKTDRANS
eukprot:scaffold109779_cov17-Prasinocladus_malaysianus.AAC.1